jgi:hypothetical protein
MSTTCGLYFVANDGVYDLAVSFLNSVRTSNPGLPLCCIPYDGHHRKIARMARQYGFQLFDNWSVLEACDEISRFFFPQAVGEFRKLASWFGRFERFVYIDVDTVVLGSLATPFQLLAEFPLIFSHSHIPSLRRFVWRDSVSACPELSSDEIALSANTGFMASKRNLFNLCDCHAAARRASRFKDLMELHCKDQGFMNYLAIHVAPDATSLHRLRTQSRIPDICHECWAGDPDWEFDSECRGFHNGRIRDVLFVHWAGKWKPHRTARVLNRTFGTAFPHIFPGVRASMPQRRLWNRYRFPDTAVSAKTEPPPTHC